MPSCFTKNNTNFNNIIKDKYYAYCLGFNYACIKWLPANCLFMPFLNSKMEQYYQGTVVCPSVGTVYFK